MKKLSIVPLLAGILGIFLTYTAVDQYILNGENIYDYGVQVPAKVVKTEVEKRSMGTSRTEINKTRYEVSIPTIQYEFEGKVYIQRKEEWASSITEVVKSSNPLLEEGDSIEILVNPNDPELTYSMDEMDPTNWVGFFIWGGIGLLLLVYSGKRILFS
jgi:hypothetical protein